LEPGSKPTNLAERWYNPADELTVAVMLKHPGPKQESFRDCAFDNGVALSVRHIFACSGLRTANGQTRAVIAGMGDDNEHKASGIYLSFPRIVDGNH
jgi:hypothetical protein